MANESPTNTTMLEGLCRLFYPSVSALAEFQEVEADAMPAAYQELLAHEHHMTVTVERFHGGPVDVRVLDKNVSGHHYSRQILLTRRDDGRVVQHGLMRIDFTQLDAEVQEAIRGEGQPLGRILIEHNVLRVVRLIGLWRVTPRDKLRQWLDMAPDAITYGRTAIIECNGEPAIELVEIVTPVVE